MTAPVTPKIYHIVHIDNLASIIREGHLWSDAAMVMRQGTTVIGMNDIKQRRLILPIKCHNDLAVGQCVPFYFCSRSIMLFVIHCANHPELSYRGGQGPIVHLECDLNAAIRWATANNKRWAFSLSNAGANYTEFRGQLNQLDELNWDAVTARDFRQADIKEGKQAEFLVEHSFPWHLVERIGVLSAHLAQQAANVMVGAPHRPRIEIKQDWYY